MERERGRELGNADFSSLIGVSVSLAFFFLSVMCCVVVGICGFSWYGVVCFVLCCVVVVLVIRVCVVMCFTTTTTHHDISQ